MWLTAAEPPAQEPQIAVILAVIGLLSAVLVALVGGYFTLKTARANKSGAPPAPTAVDTEARERIRVTEFRADDADERDKVQDMRHEASEDRHEATEGRLGRIEDYLTDLDPDWRRD